MPIYKMQGKKDGRQKYRVRINYKNAMGEDKQIDRVAYGYEEAKQLEQRLSEDIKEKPPESRMTVQALFDEYIRAKQYEVRETSLDKSRCVLELHIIPLLSSKKLDDLNIKNLQQWKESIEEKKLSIKMRQNIFGELRAMLNYAVKFGYISRNPLLLVGNFKDAYATKREITYYEPRDFMKYISSAKQEAEAQGFYEWNYYVFFNIAFYTGLRKGEIYALKWTDLSGDVISVRRSIAQKLSGGDRETPPKNKSSYRALRIPNTLKAILGQHYKRYEKIEGFNDDWRICGGVTCLRDTTVDIRNRLYSKLADIKTIRIHDFRHPYVKLTTKKYLGFCRKMSLVQRKKTA
ncbi:MAG: phage integrase SAM-like domain-containing protein [Christensenellales bacterium]|jgi:integrase